MKNFLLLLTFLFTPLFGYEFKGTHYIASYIGCKNLEQNSYVLQGFLQAASCSGATVLNHSSHEFVPSGMTAVCLLSESHASIHTYPEIGCVYVDLFTCGDSCSWEPFEDMLESFLEPESIECVVIER